ncbi:hypothetical protein JCM15519_16780 [Fundidesulfovibrio butyratiphilus]
MSFVAALPAIASLTSAGAGIAGQLLGGGQDDSAKDIRDLNNIYSSQQINYGLGSFAQGQQQLNLWNQLFEEMANRWRQQTGSQTDQMQSAEQLYSPVEAAQTQAILSDLGLYQPYKQASVQTGINALDTINRKLTLENETEGAQRSAINDVQQALDMSTGTYRPMEQRMLGRLESEAVPAAEQAWQAAQDYFNTMKEGIDPNTWADQAAGDVTAQFGTQRAAMGRNRAAMGIDPSSGVAQAADLDMAVNEALQGAGASTKARQAGILQNRQDYGVGLQALQGGANNLAGTLNTITGTVQKGPMSFGLPIFNNTMGFNPTTAKTMMMDPASSLSAGALMKQYQTTPDSISGVMSQLGSMSQQNLQNLFNAYESAKIKQSGSSESSSGAGAGALTGFGLGGLLSNNGQKSLGALADLFKGSGGTQSIGRLGS